MNEQIPPPENLVVKRKKKKRNYTPEQRTRMLANLEKARAAAALAKTRQKKYKDKKKLVEKMKRDKRRLAEQNAIDEEYNSMINTNQKVSMEVQEESSSEEEEPPPPRRRRKKKKHVKKPRKAKKKVRYYYETDESESSSEEWIPQQRQQHTYSNEPRYAPKPPSRPVAIQQAYQDRMGQIAHEFAPSQPQVTTSMIQDMIFPNNPFGNI